MAQETRPGIGPIVNCNVHLWDQRDNPVFWLADRTLVRDMLGDYESLPDRYTLADYRRETRRYDLRGVIWSDAGAADPLAAADWVSRQQGEVVPVIAMVTLGDPASAAFADLSIAAGSGRLSAASGYGCAPRRGAVPRTMAAFTGCLAVRLISHQSARAGPCRRCEVRVCVRLRRIRLPRPAARPTYSWPAG